MLYANSEVLRKVREELRDRKISVDSSAEIDDKRFYGLGSSSSGEKFPENGIERKTGISPAHALSIKGADSVYNEDNL